jgi:hypothetical protein
MKENGPNGLRAKVGALFARMKASGEPIWFYKTTGGPYARVGVPDYVLCYYGEFVGVELKGDDNEPTPRQEKELSDIRVAGGRAAVARTIEEVRAVLSEIRGRHESGAGMRRRS